MEIDIIMYICQMHSLSKKKSNSILLITPISSGRASTLNNMWRHRGKGVPSSSLNEDKYYSIYMSNVEFVKKKIIKFNFAHHASSSR